MQAPIVPVHAHSLPPVDPGFVGIDSLFPAEKQGPRGSDVDALRAEFSTSPAFGCELNPDRAIEMITGESIELVQLRAIPGSFWELARAPAASKAKLDGRRLVPDMAGLFVVACTLPGNWRREILVAAFPPDALDLVGYLPSQQLQKRLRLRAIVQDPNATRESVAAGIEGPTVDLAAVAGFVGKRRNAFSASSYK